MIKILPVSIVNFQYAKNYQNYDENTVTVAQYRELDKLITSNPIVRTYDGEKDLTYQVMAKCREIFEAYEMVADLPSIIVSWPCIDNEITKNKINELQYNIIMEK